MRDGTTRKPIVDGGVLTLLLLGVLTVLAFGILTFPNLTANEGTLADTAPVTWGFFSFGLAGLVPLAMFAFRPMLARHLPEVIGPRFNRLTVVLSVGVGVVLFPGFVWFADGGVAAASGFHLELWQKASFHLALSVGYLLALRYITLSGYWEHLRSRHEDDEDDDFIGSRNDQLTRPEYYDADIRWLLRVLVGRRRSDEEELRAVPGGPSTSDA